MSVPPTSSSAATPDPDAALVSAPAPRSTLPFVLSAVMLLIYFGFIMLVAFNKPLLGQTLVPGLSWGILLGALVIVAAWLLTLIYVLSFKNQAVKTSRL